MRSKDVTFDGHFVGLEYAGLVHETNEPGQGVRYMTEWTVGFRRYRVSSVERVYSHLPVNDPGNYPETMVFPVYANGTQCWGEVWCEREVFTNTTQHANVMKRFLEANDDADE